jgi:hypothetical protein
MIPVDTREESVREFIEKMKVYGFDKIKFPGGSSKDRRHYSRGIRYEIRENHVEFLVLPYNTSIENTREEILNPRREEPLETLIREFEEETGLIPVETELLNTAPDKGMNDHDKYYYLIHSCKGSLLSFDAKNPFEPQTGPPFWIRAHHVTKFICNSHIRSFMMAVEALKKGNDQMEAFL